MLEGMTDLLRRHLVTLLVFETGSTWEDERAAMPGTSLRKVLTQLKLHKYTCFYIGLRFLLPISPPLFHEAYDANKQHRNVLCALETPWLASLVRHYSTPYAPSPFCDLLDM